MRSRRLWLAALTPSLVALGALAQQVPNSPYVAGPTYVAEPDAPAPALPATPDAPAAPAQPVAPAAPVGPLAPLSTLQAAPSDADRAADARDNTSVPSWVRSVRVLREGEVVRRSPGGDRARRGTLALDARLPVYEAALGPGCALRWLRIGVDAWVCQDVVELRAEPPAANPMPVLVDGASLPFDYAFATFSGVRTYRRLEDTQSDDWAEELERGMGVAVRARARFAGHLWARTAAGRWIASSDLRAAHPSERRGLAFPSGARVEDVGFAAHRTDLWATAEQALGRHRARPIALLLERQGAAVLERVTVGSRTAVRTEQGWLAAEGLRHPTVSAPPQGTGATERWVDIELSTQLLVAYEGTQPVYSALISSGRPAHATRTGSYRVWVKLASSTMSNVDDEGVDEATALYSVEQVPWVMYFHDDQALHGVYWHDGFGARRSHGCVNLTPRDARALFDWAPPAMPPGWTAVLPTPGEPGLRVRVR